MHRGRRRVQCWGFRLLERVRAKARTRHYSRRTEGAYVDWVRRFVRFHGHRHPTAMGEREIAAFLTHLATERQVSASTQNQALAALLFLYRHVLGINLEMITGIQCLRVTECVVLRVKDVDLDRFEILVRGGKGIGTAASRCRALPSPRCVTTWRK